MSGTLMTSMTPHQGEITVLLFTGFREAKAGYTESQHHLFFQRTHKAQ